MLPETFAAFTCFLDVFRSFTTRETLFPAAKNVSSSRQKHFFFLSTETMFPRWQNWETSREYVYAASVSGNMFSRFARALGKLLKPDHCAYNLLLLWIYLFTSLKCFLYADHEGILMFQIMLYSPCGTILFRIGFL